jgi:hypothetical protein
MCINKNLPKKLTSKRAQENDIWSQVSYVHKTQVVLQIFVQIEAAIEG